MSDHRRVAGWVAECAPALLVGSVALRLLHGETRIPNDVDFIAPLSSLDAITEALTAQGYTWKNWDRAVAPPLALQELAGRIYLRGKHATLPTVDLTYEPPLSWTDAWSRRQGHEGIQVASPQDLATIMRARGSASDLVWCAKLIS